MKSDIRLPGERQGVSPPYEFIAAMNSRLPLLDVAGVRGERLGQSLYVERLSQSFTALIVKRSWQKA